MKEEIERFYAGMSTDDLRFSKRTLLRDCEHEDPAKRSFAEERLEVIDRILEHRRRDL